MNYKNKNLYEMIDFKDKDTIRHLLYYQAYFKQGGYTSEGGSYNRLEPQQNMYRDLIDVYIDLEELISKTKLTKKNKELLKLVQEGYGISYIHEHIEGYNRSQTLMMYKWIIEKITEKQIEIEKNEKEV